MNSRKLGVYSSSPHILFCVNGVLLSTIVYFPRKLHAQLSTVAYEEGHPREGENGFDKELSGVAAAEITNGPH